MTKGYRIALFAVLFILPLMLFCDEARAIKRVVGKVVIVESLPEKRSGNDEKAVVQCDAKLKGTDNVIRTVLVKSDFSDYQLLCDFLRHAAGYNVELHSSRDISDQGTLVIESGVETVSAGLRDPLFIGSSTPNVVLAEGESWRSPEVRVNWMFLNLADDQTGNRAWFGLVSDDDHAFAGSIPLSAGSQMTESSLERFNLYRVHQDDKKTLINNLMDAFSGRYKIRIIGFGQATGSGGGTAPTLIPVYRVYRRQEPYTVPEQAMVEPIPYSIIIPAGEGEGVESPASEKEGGFIDKLKGFFGGREEAVKEPMGQQVSPGAAEAALCLHAKKVYEKVSAECAANPTSDCQAKIYDACMYRNQVCDPLQVEMCPR